MSTESNATKDVIVTPTSFPGVSSIIIYPGTMQHIEEGHPEVATEAGIDGVVETVSNPTKVLESNRPNSLVFVNNNVKYVNAVLNVPVQLVGDNSARVVTAYYKSRKSTSSVVWSFDDAD